MENEEKIKLAEELESFARDLRGTQISKNGGYVEETPAKTTEQKENNVSISNETLNSILKNTVYIKKHMQRKSFFRGFIAILLIIALLGSALYFTNMAGPFNYMVCLDYDGSFISSDNYSVAILYLRLIGYSKDDLTNKTDNDGYLVLYYQSDEELQNDIDKLAELVTEENDYFLVDRFDVVIKKKYQGWHIGNYMMGYELEEDDKEFDNFEEAKSYVEKSRVFKEIYGNWHFFHNSEEYTGSTTKKSSGGTTSL